MTPDQKIHIQYLLSRYLNGSIIATEEQQLFQYIDEEKDNTAWQDLLEEFMASEQETIINRDEYQPILESILGKRRARVRKMGWIKWVAAAVLIAGVLTSVILLTVRVPANKHGQQQTATTPDVLAPKDSRAVITLADGTKVYLDSAGNGTIAQQDNVNVTKSNNGEIQYSANGQQLTANSPVYNTLFNPRGSKVISLTLSDGTKVWLNSESSLRYPASFAGNTREVEITGEAYFEVKHDVKQPFKVHLPNGSIVEDIGTSFNINAYPDEEATKTTLIEGSVKITSRLSAFVAKPKVGEQVIERPNSPLTKENVDVDEVMAWKNGKFSFNRADIKTVMRQLARWYDLEVVYEGPQTTDEFGGDIQRDLPLSKTLDFLKKSQVSFELQGKKLIVRK